MDSFHVKSYSNLDLPKLEYLYKINQCSHISCAIISYFNLKEKYLFYLNECRDLKLKVIKENLLLYIILQLVSIYCLMSNER